MLQGAGGGTRHAGVAGRAAAHGCAGERRTKHPQNQPTARMQRARLPPRQPPPPTTSNAAAHCTCLDRCWGSSRGEISRWRRRLRQLSTERLGCCWRRQHPRLARAWQQAAAAAVGGAAAAMSPAAVGAGTAAGAGAAAAAFVAAAAACAAAFAAASAFARASACLLDRTRTRMAARTRPPASWCRAPSGRPGACPVVVAQAPPATQQAVAARPAACRRLRPARRRWQQAPPRRRHSRPGRQGSRQARRSRAPAPPAAPCCCRVSTPAWDAMRNRMSNPPR